MGIDQLVTGGDVDDPVVDSLNTDTASINQQIAIMDKTSSQTVSHNTDTVVAYDNVISEDSSVIDADPTNGTFQLQTDGTYLLVGVARWLSDSGWTTGDISRIAAKVNGTIVLDRAQLKVSTEKEGVSVFYPSELSANDTIEFSVYQDSGGDKQIGGDTQQLRATVVRLG